MQTETQAYIHAYTQNRNLGDVGQWEGLSVETTKIRFLCSGVGPSLELGHPAALSVKPANDPVKSQGRNTA